MRGAHRRPQGARGTAFLAAYVCGRGDYALHAILDVSSKWGFVIDFFLLDWIIRMHSIWLNYPCFFLKIRNSIRGE